MDDQQVCSSRRLRGISPTNVEPSSRRRRSSYVVDFQPVAVDASEIILTLGALISQGEPSSVHNLDGNSLVLSRVPFQSEDEIDIEYVSESPVTPSTPLPSHLPYVVSYVGTLTHRPTSPVHSPFFQMANVSGAIMVANASGVPTPPSVAGGDTISISIVTPSTLVVGSTSILSLSGGHPTFCSFHWCLSFRDVIQWDSFNLPIYCFHVYDFYAELFNIFSRFFFWKWSYSSFQSIFELKTG